MKLILTKAICLIFAFNATHALADLATNDKKAKEYFKKANNINFAKQNLEIMDKFVYHQVDFIFMKVKKMNLQNLL